MSAHDIYDSMKDFHRGLFGRSDSLCRYSILSAVLQVRLSIPLRRTTFLDRRNSISCVSSSSMMLKLVYKNLQFKYQ